MPSEPRERIDRLNERSWKLALSQPRKALDAAERASEYATTHNYPYGRAVARLNAGWALVYLGDYDRALTCIYEARATFDLVGDQRGQIQTLNALGVVSQRIGEFEQARGHYEESLHLAEATGDTDRQLAALNNIAELSCEMKEYLVASDLLDRAMALCKCSDDPSAEATIAVNRGLVALRLERAEEAVTLLVEARRLAVDAQDRIAESDALCYLADAVLLHATPDLTPVELYEASITLCRRTGHRDGLITALVRLGELHVANGRVTDARELLLSALGFATTPEWWSRVQRTIELLARTLEEGGDLRGTLDLYRQLAGVHQLHAEDTAERRLATLRHYHQLEQSRVETETIRRRSTDLQSRFDLLQTRNTTLQLIYAIGREVTASFEMNEIAQRLYRALNEVMIADVFGIAIVDEEKRTLDFAHVLEANQRLTPFSIAIDDEHSFGSWSVRNARELVLNDSPREHAEYVTRHRPFSAGDSLSLVYMPLVYEEAIVGVLTVQSYRRNAYSPDQIDLLRMLAPYLGIALDNSRKMATINRLNARLSQDKTALEQAYTQISHMANHDILTGLPNRRLLVELIEGHIPLARRNGEQFGVLYLDLDGFKPVNDMYGHQKGDEVLVEIAERLRRAVRESDSVARLGGDEFVLLVRDVAGRDALVHIAQKVQRAVSQPIDIGGDSRVLSVSIGAGMFPANGETCDALLSAVDGAMYRSKQSGEALVSFASGR